MSLKPPHIQQLKSIVEQIKQDFPQEKVDTMVISILSKYFKELLNAVEVVLDENNLANAKRMVLNDIKSHVELATRPLEKIQLSKREDVIDSLTTTIILSLRKELLAMPEKYLDEHMPIEAMGRAGGCFVEKICMDIESGMELLNRSAREVMEVAADTEKKTSLH